MEIKITNGKTAGEFLAKYKDKSVWSLAWSLYWRGYVALLGVMFCFWIVVVLAALLLDQ